MKRARALALRSVTKSSAPIISVATTVRPQVAREKERKMPTKIDEREQRRCAAPRRSGRVSARRTSTTKGKIRNGPKTFGSWKPPVARPNFTKSSPVRPK